MQRNRVYPKHRKSAENTKKKDEQKVKIQKEPNQRKTKENPEARFRPSLNTSVMHKGSGLS